MNRNLFAFDPPDPSTIVRPPQQDDRPTYSDIQTLVTFPLNISTTLLGTGAQTVSEAAALGAIGFAINVPISVMFRWNNPGLTTNQKWVMTGYDVGVGLVGIGLGCLLVTSPLGSVAVVGIPIAYSIITYAGGTAIENNYLNINRRGMSIH